MSEHRSEGTFTVKLLIDFKTLSWARGILLLDHSLLRWTIVTSGKPLEKLVNHKPRSSNIPRGLLNR